MNPVSGFGFYGAGGLTQIFAIFKDGTRSHHHAEELDQFKETYFDQTLTPIKTITAYYLSEEQEDDTGVLLGIQLLDFSDQRICRAGDTLKNIKSTKVKEFELKEGEKLLGIVYGRRMWPDFCPVFDVQFRNNVYR
jgi:hypothetical protein